MKTVPEAAKRSCLLSFFGKKQEIIAFLLDISGYFRYNIGTKTIMIIF